MVSWKDFVVPSPLMVPGSDGQFVTGAVNPAALVKQSVYVTLLALANEIVLTPFVRPMFSVTWEGVVLAASRVKVMVPSGLSSK